ncbi:MAG TPA: chemotaxis protein, partial [Ramlibacter sp.]
MKFRTRIWMLPFSAAIVFVIGVAVSYAVGARTLEALNRLSRVDGPALQQLRLAEQGVEQFRLLLQSAAVEGDADRLKDVQASVERTRSVLAALRAIEGEELLADGLRGAWDAYQSTAVGAAQAMLQKTEAGDLVQRMQAAQGTLDRQLRAAVDARVARTNELQARAVRGVGDALWVTLVIGIVVLAVLGLASRLVIASVWRDLGEEPRTLHLLTRRI